MTLVIAFILMNEFGYTNPFAYLGVFFVWFVHVAYHDSLNKRQTKEAIAEWWRNK